MKPPRPKIHLADRDSPILDYSNVEVTCGAVLAHAEPKWMIQDVVDPDGLAIPPRDLCTPCRKAYEAIDVMPAAAKSYVYGLVNAQENLGASEGDNEA